MKKSAIFLLLSLIIAGLVSAQPIRDQRDSTPRTNNDLRREVVPPNRENQFEYNPVTINGTLKLQRGLIAIESGDAVYYVPMLNRYVGFINGLSEGTRVSVEGLQFRNFIRPIKITIEDRSYDFPAHRYNQGQFSRNHNHRWNNHGNNNERNHEHRRNHGHNRNHSRNNHNNNNRRCNCCSR